MPPRTRRGKKRAARAKSSGGPAPFAVVAFSAADFDSAEEAVDAARQVVAAAQDAPGGRLYLALDCGGAEDWAPAFAPFADVGPAEAALRAFLDAPPAEPRYAAHDQPVCVFGVAGADGREEKGRLRLRRGLYFRDGGVGVFVYWAALLGSYPRRRSDRDRLLDAADAKVTDLLGSELLSPDDPDLEGAVVHGVYDWPGVRLAQTRWGGGLQATALVRGPGAGGCWPADCPPFLPPDSLAFARDFRATGVQVFPGAKAPPPPHRALRGSSPLGAALGMQEEDDSDS